MTKKLKRVLCIGDYYTNIGRSNQFDVLLEKQNIKVIKMKFKSTDKIFIIKEFFKNFKKLRNLDYDLIIYFSFPFSILIFLVKLLSIIKKVPIVNNFDISRLNFKFDRNFDKWIGFTTFVKYFIADKIDFLLSNKIYCITSAQIEQFHKRFNISKKKCEKIFIGADESLFYPRDKNKNSESPLIIGFWGSFIPLHGIQYIIEAAKLLKNEKNIKFVMIGEGQTYNDAVKLKEKYKIENIEFLGYLPLNEFITQLSKIDISLGTFGGTKKSSWCITNKVFESIAMGLPVITQINPANLELFTHKKNIFFSKPEDPKSLSKAILELTNNKKLREKISKNGYKLFREKCSDLVLGKELESSFIKLLKK